MFDVGWTEMLVIAIVMIVVVGPKDLPNMLRTMGRMASKARGMANDFRRQFDEALKEAELDDIKKSVDELRGLNPMTEVRKQLNPFEKAAADLRAGVENTMKPKPAAPPAVEGADAPATPAEPLKNGAADMPDVSGPQAMPEAPAFTAEAEGAAGTGTAVPAAKAVRKRVSSGTKAAKAASVAKAATGSSAKAPAAKAGGSAAGKAKGAASTKSKSADAAARTARTASGSAKSASSKPASPAKSAARKKTARAK
jgi:sec-independent protein translocase protein TatB